MTLVRTGPARDTIDDLRTALARLDAELSQRATELRQTQAALAAFRLRYRTEVGQLHEELDELQRAITEAELDRKMDRPDGS